MNKNNWSKTFYSYIKFFVFINYLCAIHTWLAHIILISTLQTKGNTCSQFIWLLPSMLLIILMYQIKATIRSNRIALFLYDSVNDLLYNECILSKHTSPRKLISSQSGKFPYCADVDVNQDSANVAATK